MIALVIIALMTGFLLGAVLVTLAYDVKIWRLKKQYEKIEKARCLAWHKATLAAIH